MFTSDAIAALTTSTTVDTIIAVTPQIVPYTACDSITQPRMIPCIIVLESLNNVRGWSPNLYTYQ